MMSTAAFPRQHATLRPATVLQRPASSEWPSDAQDHRRATHEPCAVEYARVLYTGRGDLCRNVYQQLSKLGSLELQAVLNKMLDEVATPIKFCQYKLHGPSGADAGLKVPDSPSGKLIQVWPSLF